MMTMHCRLIIWTICGICVTVLFHTALPVMAQCSNIQCVNGICVDGTTCQPCSPGFYGDWCERSCRPACESCGSHEHCLSCKRGYYGHVCSQPCPMNCINGACSQDGTCDTCPPSCETCHSGTNCSTCNAGYYDLDCSKLCVGNCLHKQCLQNGYCQDCVTGFFGAFCDTPCPLQCVNKTCDAITGHCDACELGHFGSLCNSTCPSSCNLCFSDQNCTSCRDGYFGVNCNNVCPSNCISCLSEANCTLCKVGYFGPNCNMACTNCTSSSPCRQWDGYCFEGCGNGMSGQHCNESCTPACIKCQRGSKGVCDVCENGRFGIASSKNVACIFDCPSNCLDAACAINDGTCLKGCKPNFYGDNCSKPCPSMCAKGGCDRSSGSCIYGCITGYHGIRCQCPINCMCNESSHCFTCIDGFENTEKLCKCSKSLCANATCSTCTNDVFYTLEGSCCSCSSNCKDGTCSSATTCLSGCKAGFYGTDCSGLCSDVDVNCEICSSDSQCLKCKSSFYKDHEDVCVKCPNKCVGETCEDTTGRCNNGCIQGYWRDTCESHCPKDCSLCEVSDGTCLKCVPGRYLSDCSAMCSNNCKTDTGDIVQCEIQSGECVTGCKVGFFSNNCTKSCDVNCVEQMCDQDNGNCSKGCASGYSAFGNQCIEVKGSTSIKTSWIVSAGTSAAFIIVTGVLLVIVVKRRCWKPVRGQRSGDDICHENSSVELPINDNVTGSSHAAVSYTDFTTYESLYVEMEDMSYEQLKNLT